MKKRVELILCVDMNESILLNSVVPFITCCNQVERENNGYSKRFSKESHIDDELQNMVCEFQVLFWVLNLE